MNIFFSTPEPAPQAGHFICLDPSLYSVADAEVLAIELFTKHSLSARVLPANPVRPHRVFVESSDVLGGEIFDIVRRACDSLPIDYDDLTIRQEPA